MFTIIARKYFLGVRQEMFAIVARKYYGIKKVLDIYHISHIIHIVVECQTTNISKIVSWVFGKNTQETILEIYFI